MTFTWWLVPIVALGLGLIFAPVLGLWWARDWRPARCPRCQRELIGSPPEHTRADRLWCQAVAVREGDLL